MPKRSLNRILDEYLLILVSSGNHDAFQRLKKRYRIHSLYLCDEIWRQYRNTGIGLRELHCACNGCFLSTVRKYDSQMGSFFSFWKDNANHNLVNYLIENNFLLIDSNGFVTIISLDQSADRKRPFCDMLCEKDDERLFRKKTLDIKSFINRHLGSFSSQEVSLLKLILDGFSLSELEHSGWLSRSTLYLTFKAAVEKLKKLIERLRRNKS